MTGKLFLLLITWIVLQSCDGQQVSAESKIELKGPLVAAGDTVEELSNNIMAVYHDTKGNYWFASWQDGLYKYDGKTILHFNTNKGLPHNRVEDIQEDKNGNLFFNTSGGLVQFDGNDFRVLHPVKRNEWALGPDDLWFKSSEFEGRILRFDGRVLYELSIPECDLGRKWVAEHPANPSPYGIYTIYKDRMGNIWFGTAALGAFRYNGKSFDWISENDVTELHDGPSNGVRSIIEDRDGYFWFNSAYRYEVYGNGDADSDPFYRRVRSFGNLDGLPDSDFWEYLSIAKDNSQNLWMATYRNGVWRYDGTGTVHYPVQADGADIHVFSIYRDNAGDLWLGTHANGAYRFNGKSFVPFHPE